VSKRSWKVAVWNACNGICVVCGKGPQKKNPLTVHHKKAASRGGKNTVENCVLWHKQFHQDYHRKHGTRESDTFGNPI
jgi:5-methylcytosine-specific restriction endonuclease McrA